jgi:hypothetical protein
MGKGIKNLQHQCDALAKEDGFHEVEEANVVELLEPHKEELQMKN